MKKKSKKAQVVKPSKKTKAQDIVYVEQQVVSKDVQKKQRKLAKAALKNVEQWANANGTSVEEIRSYPKTPVSETDLATLKTQAIDAMNKCIALLQDTNEPTEKTPVVKADNSNQKMKVIAVKDDVAVLNEHFEKGWTISPIHGAHYRGESTLFFLERV